MKTSCELHYSGIMIRSNESQVIFYKKVYGYIRRFDKAVELGEEIIGKMDLDKYRTQMKERLQKSENIW